MLHTRAIFAAVAVLLAAGCTGGSRPSSTPSSNAGPTASARPGEPAFVTRSVNFYGPNDKQRTVRLAVYPAVRVQEHLLVPVDLTAEGSDAPAGSDYFCTSGVVCSDFGATSLVDPVGLIRYGPLREGSARGDVLSSSVPYELKRGSTYHAGVLFPLPDGSPAAVDLDLQLGGVVTGLPVTDGPTRPGLLGGSSASASAGSDVVLPVPSPRAPFADRHPLLTKVVGGSIGQGGSTAQGVVSLAADVLFAFDSADLTPQAQAVVQQAAGILAGSADPGKPVAVTGYTDAKGTTAYNADLSQRRAAAVAGALRGDPRLSALTFTPAGRGAADPVAANALPDGTDNPAGRALNRRVELSYTPKPEPVATPPPSSSGAPGAATAGSGSPAPAATLSAPSVVAGGAGAVPMSAAVRQVRREGRLTLVEVAVTPGKPAGGVDYFARARNNRDVGAWHLLLPATGAAYVPATDADDADRLLGTTVKAMNADREYLLSFWTEGLPSGTGTVTVDLGQLGQAKDVPVTG